MSVIERETTPREPRVELVGSLSRSSSGTWRSLVFGPDVRLTCEQVELAGTDASLVLGYTERAVTGMEASRAGLEQAHRRGDQIYGLTTGFGPLVTFEAAAGSRHGAGLTAHLGAGFGPRAPIEIVRATMALRCQAIAQGHSGIEPAAARAFLRLLERSIIPSVPEIGSVGASGDLCPLAHIVRVMMGLGEVVRPDAALLPARDALRSVGIDPIELSGRDALALVNGTSFMSAYASLAIARAERLLARAEALTGWLYRLLGARAQALDPRLHEARGHAGQAASAANIRAEAARQGEWEDTSRPLQEVYSIRCAPQVLGACRDNLAHARATLEREINGVNDNPFITRDGHGAWQVLHGGNFQGQQVAFASDALNAALVQAAVLAERQIDVLVNPELNAGAPLLLAWEPGATSGVAGAQLTATALVAEMRHHGGPCATMSIPTNGRNQDVVSMGTLAARAAYGQVPRLAAVLAVLAIALDQLTFLRQRGKAPGRVAQRPQWMPAFEGFEEDRALLPDIERLAREWVKS